jgi:hypothetical protein
MIVIIVIIVRWQILGVPIPCLSTASIIWRCTFPIESWPLGCILACLLKRGWFIPALGEFSAIPVPG